MYTGATGRGLGSEGLDCVRHDGTSLRLHAITRLEHLNRPFRRASDIIISADVSTFPCFRKNSPAVPGTLVSEY